MSPHSLVDTEEGLRTVVGALRGEPAYAVDTEFHRERTYFPRLALVQIAWDEHLALIDPLAVDVAPLGEVFDGRGVAVLHAADQDLEVLDLACGTIPSRVFDTQVAAGFVGMSNPSLAALYERVLGIRVPKGHRLTDWLARPLDDQQLDYAAGDVEHLLEVYEKLLVELDARGRRQWVLDECEELRTRERGARDPDEAWRRVKEIRQLRGTPRRVAQAVAAWRERRAAATDQPVRHVLPDLAIVGIAQRHPKTVDQLRQVRGLDDRHLRGPQASEILAAVADASDAPPRPQNDGESHELERELRPAVALVSAWVSQLSRNLEIDTGLLGTRADIEALLRGDRDARLAHGWRAELVGEPIRRLVDGEAALAFDRGGELRLEARSGRPL
ncbi:MAG TPA: HRDC domain-containing protein [Acidimicrobiales bacterium]|nr:HRDC domain-containing protein [Acidimicrobiales bacterium]